MKYRIHKILVILVLISGCSRQRFEQYIDPVVMNIKIDKLSFVKEMQSVKRYMSLCETAGMYAFLVAVDAGIAIAGSRGGGVPGVDIPITTEIRLRDKVGKELMSLKWGDNYFVCERSDLTGEFTVTISSPRLFKVVDNIRVSGGSNRIVEYMVSVEDGIIWPSRLYK